MTGLLAGTPGGVSLWAGKLVRASHEDLSESVWDQVLLEFEAKVAAGRIGNTDLEALDALAHWQANHKLSVEDFRREREAIPNDPPSRDQRITVRLQLASALRHCKPTARFVAPQVRPAPVATPPTNGTRAWTPRAVAPYSSWCSLPVQLCSGKCGSSEEANRRGDPGRS